MHQPPHTRTVRAAFVADGNSVSGKTLQLPPLHVRYSLRLRLRHNRRPARVTPMAHTYRT